MRRGGPQSASLVCASLPPPRSNTLIENYLHTGRSSAMDTTRVMLAKHRVGHLVPIQARAPWMMGGREGGRHCTSLSLTHKCLPHTHARAPLQFRLRDLPPGESLGGGGASKSFTLLAMIKLIDARGDASLDGGGEPETADTQRGGLSEERLLIDERGGISSGTPGALALLQVRWVEGGACHWVPIAPASFPPRVRAAAGLGAGARRAPRAPLGRRAGLGRRGRGGLLGAGHAHRHHGERGGGAVVVG